ncbi:hypothetical protein [Streptomyces sp. NPDC056194]|uniref:hypothetical protein n=1 Tax=unclassified Streptomyces TaxID=2593676 RepID=UPI0035E352B0
MERHPGHGRTRRSGHRLPKGFKALGPTYGKVEKLPAPKPGDQAVAYRITGDIGKQKIPMTYTVVLGSGANMLDPNHAAVPEAVVKAQLDRLRALTRKPVHGRRGPPRCTEHRGGPLPHSLRRQTVS